jgi:hypothetical protein
LRAVANRRRIVARLRDGGVEAARPVVPTPERTCRVEVLCRGRWLPARYPREPAEALAAAHSYRADAGLPARAVGPEGTALPWRAWLGTVDLARKLLAAGPAAEWRCVQPGRAEAELLTVGGLVAGDGPGLFVPVRPVLATVVDHAEGLTCGR